MYSRWGQVSLLICKYSPFRSGRDAVVATQNEAELKEAPGPDGQYWIGQGGPQHNLPLPERLEKLDNISSNACNISANMEIRLPTCLLKFFLKYALHTQVNQHELRELVPGQFAFWQEEASKD